MELAALIVAIVAVVVSFAAAGWSAGWSIWHHRRTTTPVLLVDGGFAVLGTEPIAHVFTVRAVNEGPLPFTISSAFAEVDGADRYFAFVRFVMQSPRPLSTRLEVGDAWNGAIDADDFRAGVAEVAERRGLEPPWRVRVGVGSAGRRSFRSDWFEVHRGPD